MVSPSQPGHQMQQPAGVVSEVREIFGFQIQLFDSDFEYFENAVSKIFSKSLHTIKIIKNMCQEYLKFKSLLF